MRIAGPFDGLDTMESITDGPGGTSLVVGVGLIKLIVHNSSSLKAKRKIVKSILGRVRSKFDVSIAEVDHQDKWQLCSIGFSVVSNDRGVVHNMLETIIDYVERLHLAEVVDFKIEILDY